MRINIFLVVFLVVFLNSCQTDTLKTDTPAIQTDSLKLKVAKLEGVCQIEIPSYFTEMNDINADALIQYGYIAKEDSTSILEQDEFYTMVLVNYKSDIKKIVGDTINVDLEYLYNRRVLNLDQIFDDFTIENDKPIIQTQNNLNTIHNEFYGRLGESLVYYQFRIYETESGFFQVLSWCMQDYKEKHKAEMYKITSSFKTLKAI